MGHKPRTRATALTLATGCLAATIALAAGSTQAAGSSPQPRDINGNLSNQITSTSTTNCITGTEPGCTTTTERVVPMVDPAAAAIAATVPIALGALVLYRRRATNNH